MLLSDINFPELESKKNKGSVPQRSLPNGHLTNEIK